VIELAAKKLEVTANQLDVKGRQVYIKSSPKKSISVAEIAHDAIYNYSDKGAQISATGSFLSTSHNPNFQAAFTEIEVRLNKALSERDQARNEARANHKKYVDAVNNYRTRHTVMDLRTAAWEDRLAEVEEDRTYLKEQVDMLTRKLKDVSNK